MTKGVLESHGVPLIVPPSLPPSPLPPSPPVKHGNEYVATEMFVFGGRNALNYHSMNDIVLLSYLVKGGRENEGGEEEGRFVWSRPEVEGELPEPRESHGAVVVPGTEAEGGDR